MTTWTMKQTVDLERGAKPRDWQTFCLTAGDAEAHAWQATVTRGGKAAQVSGTTTAYYIRQDGKTVIGPAQAEDGVVTAVLPAEAYRVPGVLYGVLRASDGDQITTLATARWLVTEGPTDALLDPEPLVPSLDALLARLDEMDHAASDARLAATEARQTVTGIQQTVAELQQTVMEFRQTVDDCYPTLIQPNEPVGRCVWIRPL